MGEIWPKKKSVGRRSIIEGTVPDDARCVLELGGGVGPHVGHIVAHPGRVVVDRLVGVRRRVGQGVLAPARLPAAVARRVRRAAQRAVLVTRRRRADRRRVGVVQRQRSGRLVDDLSIKNRSAIRTLFRWLFLAHF